MFFYSQYKNGFLPDQGGVTDQSSKALEIFTVIDQAADECARKKAEDKAARRS